MFEKFYLKSSDYELSVFSGWKWLNFKIQILNSKLEQDGKRNIPILNVIVPKQNITLKVKIENNDRAKFFFLTDNVWDNFVRIKNNERG